MRLLPAAFALVLAAPAAAQSPPPICMPVEKLVEILRDEYRERLTASGVMENGLRVLLFATEDGATWTLVMLGPSGGACVGPTGSTWRATGRGA